MRQAMFHVVGVLLLIAGTPTGTVATRSVLASSSSSGELQDLSAPFGGTEGQALDKHIELPDYLTARAEGLLLKEH
ncbi:hypothetical protein WJX79_009381 [Trebouxia sp. C0005]